jgi:hypothetical protein
MALSVLGPPRAARAESSTPASAAAAEALFRDGHRLLAEGRVAEACGKFAESQRLDPEIGTLLNLALCHERERRVATAWVELTQVETLAARAGQAERAAFASERAARLERELPRLKLVVTDEAAANLRIDLDAATLGPSAWSTPLPIDPGEHVIEAVRAGQPRWTKRVLVADAPGTVEVAIPRPEAPAPPATTSAPIPAGRIAAWSLMGASAVAFGAAVVYGVTSASRARLAGELEPDEEAAGRAHDQAALLRNYAIVAGLAGGVALGLGVVFFVSSKPSSTPRPSSVRLRVVPPVGAILGGTIELRVGL